jgi:phage terminase large subunit
MVSKLHNELLSPRMRDLFFRRGENGEAAYIPSRYKVAKGGRGSTKTWSYAGVAASLSAIRPLRVLWVREVQASIKESVHKLLTDRVDSLGLRPYFDVQDQGIYGKHNGSEHIFAGIKTDPGKIKSTEGIDLCIVVEAEKLSDASWRMLIPTIRKPGSEIWVEYNPRELTDPTHKRFALRMPPNCRRVHVNFDSNPWFPAELELERQYALQLIREAKDDDERVQLQADYDHVWLGECQTRSDAAIFRRRVVVEDFPEPSEEVRIHLGADWGFANDPSALLRFWITDDHGQQELWISHEAFGFGVELDDLFKLFAGKEGATPDQLKRWKPEDEVKYPGVPGSRKWPIKADCARPETISYMRRQGFNISAAEKWQGSVEDGITHIKGFHRIHIHTRCKRLQEEARLYSYKVDRITGEVLPVIVDAHNHGWDAIRYGLDGYIQRRGVSAVWAKLAQ